LHGKKPKASGSNADASKPKDESEPDGVWLVCTQETPESEPEDTPSMVADSATSVRSSTATHGAIIELYNSGASQHMSPYHEHFLNFRSISPHPIQAADKRNFEAIGKGDLPIEVPNSRVKTCILLMNVLYAPSMGATLVSISKLTSAGYAALFRGNSCRIFDAKKKQLGEVIISGGLYCVKHPPTSFAAAVSSPKTLTMEELHQRMAHIPPSAIREMLAKGMVEGVQLNPKHEMMGQCEACEYAKATHKPIGKEREPKQQDKLGDEVHTDLWGPSQVQTPSGKSYYVSFTDDNT